MGIGGKPRDHEGHSSSGICERIIRRLLAGRRQHWARVYYERHQEHFTHTVHNLEQPLVLTGLAAVGLFIGMLRGWACPQVTSVAVAVFLLVGLTAFLALMDCLRARVLPYFEQPVGGPSTFMEGRSLLWHSRWLDVIAAKHGVRPLSEFASGDDLIPGEQLHWFCCNEAMATVECLLTQAETECLPLPLIFDLVHLREALRLAAAKEIRFCLLLREGSATSGWEISQRKGSFF